MATFTQWGNDLYTGKTSIDFVGRRRIWFAIAIALVAISVVIPIVKGGFNLGIEFTGGSQFVVSGVSDTDDTIATGAVSDIVGGAASQATAIGDDSVRVQTDQLTSDESNQVTAALAEAYDVDPGQVTSSFVGASWGADITEQALLALGVFLLLVFIIMAFYFRTWKMSAAAMVGLLDVLVITIGVYALSGFAITPATVIGFLTILGYSLYDTVVVFDKIRENTEPENPSHATRTFHQSVNLAVNQTLIRSINTTIVAALPVASILFLGAFALGAETLKDISLSLLVGIIVSAYSTIFVAAPLYALMRGREAGVLEHDRTVREARERAAEDDGDAASA